MKMRMKGWVNEQGIHPQELMEVKEVRDRWHDVACKEIEEITGSWDESVSEIWLRTGGLKVDSTSRSRKEFEEVTVHEEAIPKI